MSLKEIVISAGLPETYQTEIRKGINLARYVIEKPRAGTFTKVNSE